MATSATTGVMNPLLGKLTMLLGEEYKKLTGVRKQASFLKDELSAMKALLDKMELMDKLDPSAKNWRDHVREMSYDMENCIDDFIHEIEGNHSKSGFVKKMAQRLRRLGKCHQIANRIEELKTLAFEASARRERYKIDDCVNSSPDFVVVDPRISAIYKEAAGLGKTTLAKQVYDQIGEQFSCKAFFSVSQRPDVKSLLSGLPLKLGMGNPSHACELQDIIDCLREHLKHQRYFIVVDDLWDEPTWNIISCAFSENSNGSRVMVTTRLDDIATRVCQRDCVCIYRMKPLKEQDSRRLFFDRVFGSENVCPTQFKDISVEILRKCGGLPLAIITIASLLASHEARSLNGWENIKNYLGTKFSTKPTLEEMRGILNLSYMHLPVHLRPCFLYLGMYPEDREINRDDVARQWISEGFVVNSHGVDLDDVARSYFNELINRSLIQPEETYHWEVLSFRVHDMMLDLILSKSAEDNFISVSYKYEDMAILSNREYKVRRLSIQSSTGGETSTNLATSMSQVRSCALFRESKYIPPLSQFKHLRVLLFEFPDLWEWTIDLTVIGHLFLLRYLKVFATLTPVALPTEIKGLVHLETLELYCEPTESFPSDIACLTSLFHLVLPLDIALPKGIQNMKSVRTLHCSCMSKCSVEDIKGLSKLTSLKKLTLCEQYGQFLTVEGVDALTSSIGMLRDLKHISLDSAREFDDYGSHMDSILDPPPRLEVLDLERWELTRVPKWIGGLSCLRILNLCVLHLSDDEFRILGELPSLVNALFYVLDVSQDKVVVGTGLFPVLEDLFFRYDEDDATAYLSFEEGALLKLQKLTLGFGWEEWRGATPVGMEYLPCLEDIRVWLEDTITESSKCWRDVRGDIESAFKDAAWVHPRNPFVTIFDRHTFFPHFAHMY